MASFNKATIKDVAEKAGVSISTVSRMINGNYPISDETREKITNAINDTKYQPNELARSLKNGRSKIVGVVVPNIANRFFMRLARGIENILEPLDYSIIVSSTYNDYRKEERVLNTLAERSVDALVVASSFSEPKRIEDIFNGNTPLVLVERRIPGICADMILEDNFTSSYKLVKQLVDNGHKKIAVIRSIKNQSTSIENFAGYKKALTEKGIELDERYVIRGELDRNKAYEGVIRIFETLPKEEWPTAIFSMSSIMCESAMLALRDIGLSIPDDISLVSYGEFSSEFIMPKITCVKQDADRMGEKAAEIILERLDEATNSECNRHFREILFDTEIVIGGSIKNIDQ